MANKNTLESFVARIWLEPGQNGDPIWRGHVRHVQDEQETYFKCMEELSGFLEQVSGVSGPKLINSQSAGENETGDTD